MNSIIRAILYSLLICGSSLLVPHHLYAGTPPPGWGTATSIGNTFTPPAQFPKIAVDLHGDAIAVWQQGDSADVLSIWANRYDVGSGSWGTATLIESNSGVATKPQVAMDNNGNAEAVWIQNDGTYNRMWANRYVAGQGWGTPQEIENNPGDADFPRVAVNGSGNAMALWKQFNGVNYDIWANRYDVASGTWGTPTLIESSSQDASEPWVAMDNSGNAMAVWRQSDGGDLSIWANRYDAGSGTWGTATLLENNPGFASFPHVGFDNSGNAIVVWYQAFGQANSSRHIWANRYVVGSGWGTATRLDSYTTNCAVPSLSVNGGGNAMAVWRQPDTQGAALSIWANQYDVVSGSWGTATLIETSSGAADLPDVAMDSSGNATAVWKQSDDTFNSIYANRYVAGQGWGTATLIETQTGAADNPKVETDGNGNAIAVWQQKKSIGANRFATGAAPGTTFTDVTTQAGLSGCPTCQLNSSWCVAWADYDGDGFIDLITLGHIQNLTGSISQLWHNNGDGTFTDVTSQAGLDPHNGDAHGAVWADFDNDGLLDLFVAKGTMKTDPVNNDDLWHSNGDGTFTNIADSAGVQSGGHRNRGAGAVDYDNDSFLDIFVTSFQRPTNGGRNLLYRNNGDLTFTDVAEAAGLQRPDITNRASAWADYDGDGLIDVFITQIDALYKNNGDGTFTDVTDAAGIIHNSADVQVAAWGDYDDDGYPDIYVTLGVDNGGQADICEDLQDLAAIPLTQQLPNILYHNNGDGTFTDVTTQSGTTNVAGAIGVTWEDYDNDGYLDLYIVNIGLGLPNRLFRNNGDGTFTDVASEAGVGAKLAGNGKGSDATFGDYDNDGFPDLVVDNGGANTVGTYILFHNNGNSNGWLKVVLRGTQSNLCGIGSKLRLVAGGKTQYREYTGQHYMGQNYIPVHFGLGPATNVASLTIMWPSGTVQTLTNVAVNQTITVIESAARQTSAKATKATKSKQRSP